MTATATFFDAAAVGSMALVALALLVVLAVLTGSRLPLIPSDRVAFSSGSAS